MSYIGAIIPIKRSCFPFAEGDSPRIHNKVKLQFYSEMELCLTKLNSNQSNNSEKEPQIPDCERNLKTSLCGTPGRGIKPQKVIGVTLTIENEILTSNAV